MNGVCAPAALALPKVSCCLATAVKAAQKSFKYQRTCPRSPSRDTTGTELHGHQASPFVAPRRGGYQSPCLLNLPSPKKNWRLPLARALSGFEGAPVPYAKHHSQETGAVWSCGGGREAGQQAAHRGAAPLRTLSIGFLDGSCFPSCRGNRSKSEN